MQTPSRRGARRGDDRGFTLVELIVAVVILAIVFVPLLHTFVTGAQTEAKSRRYQEATAAAQNIIETVQAQDIDDLLKNPTLWGGGAAGSFSDPSKPDASPAPSVAPSPTGLVKFPTADGKYNAEISYTEKGNPGDNGSTGDFVSGSSIDALFDMTSADDAASNDLNASAAASGSDPSVSLSKRTITITAGAPEAADGVAYYPVTATFNYTGSYSYTDETGVEHSVNNATAAVTSTEKVTKNITAAGEPAFSVYLFYRAGSIKINGSSSDTITIYNNINDSNGESDEKKDFNVFLVDATEDSAKPTNYSPVITYRPQNTDGSRVFSNFDNAGSTTKYSSFRGKLWYKKAVLQKKLVSTEQKPRELDVTVTLYPVSGTEAICTMKAAKIG